jgi:hypothetical protein
MNSNFNSFLLFLQENISAEITINENVFIFEKHKLAFLFFENNKKENIIFNENYFQDLINKYERKRIQLVIVLESQWHEKQAIVKSRLASFFSKTKTIHARKTKFLRIDKQIAEMFLNKNHLQGYVSSKLKYGLYLNDELVAVATFSAGRKMKDKPEKYRSYELIRFANKVGMRVIGGLSKLIVGFTKEREIGNIMTYIDKAWSKGDSFEKIGFVRSGELPPFEIDNTWNAGSIKMILECEK